jgi:hypothetical protein
MLDQLKTYLVDVLIKKCGPSFVKGAVTALFVYLGAHQGLLNSLGITWDASGHTLDIDFDTLSTWAFTIGSGAIMAFLTAAQHHTTAAITGQPQDGAHQRADDPPKAA